ncbi:MAG: cell wall protein [Leifsonia xyli]|nr:MAG: cell wall protein [Leifsonia xyli]
MYPHASSRIRAIVGGAVTAALIAGGALVAGSAARAADAPTVVINEVESNAVEKDWVELKNIGTDPVDVSGWIMKDDDDTRTKAIPAGTTIAPGGYFSFVVDEKPNGFGLGKADSARLYLGDGTTLVDGTSWGPDHAPYTWGRCADGTGAFVQTTASTRDAANACPDAAATLKINEAVSDGGTPGDWIEFVNTGDVPVNAGGLVVRDEAEKTPYTIPADTWVAGGGYLVLDNGTDFAYGLGKGDSVRLFATDGATLLDSTTWPAGTHASPSWGRCPDASGAFAMTVAATKGAANDCDDSTPPVDPSTANVVINEAQSNGDDWVELKNLDNDNSADIGGWGIVDSDTTRTPTRFAAGTVIESGGYLVIERAALGFGLGDDDAVILSRPDGSIADSTSWTGQPAGTWARCPDGTGAFRDNPTATKGLVNDCSDPGTDPGTLPEGVVAWPGGSSVSTVPTDIPFAGDLSGLDYEVGVTGDGTMWAVTNGTGVLSKLTPGADGAWNGATGWGAGKQLAYADGSTAPDAEGVTVADGGSAGGVYVASERSSSASSVSRPSILRYDVSGTGTILRATNEWNLSADLTSTVGTIGANSGLEGITWVPDSVLTARKFLDEATGRLYDPALYPNHGTGVFFVALEATGDVYAYVLDLTGSTAVRVATIDTPGAMELDYEPETQLLWAICDQVCEGRTATLQIGASGAYEVTARYARPADSANYANEGFVIAPQSTCVSGSKPVYYADDANTAGVSLRVGSIRCTALPGTGGGDGGTDPGTNPGTGGGTTAPEAPAETDLTPTTQNGVTGPSSARAGSTITVAMGVERAGDRVDGWVFSTPSYLGARTVSAAGTIQLTIPATLAPGAHRVAVLAADGTVIGWFALAVSPAAIASTGVDAAATNSGIALAAVLLVAGLALVVVRRRVRLVA